MTLSKGARAFAAELCHVTAVGIMPTKPPTITVKQSKVGFITPSIIITSSINTTSSSSSATPHSMMSSCAAVAYSPPIHSAISFHRGLGSCRHCFNTRGRDAAAVHLRCKDKRDQSHEVQIIATPTRDRCHEQVFKLTIGLINLYITECSSSLQSPAPHHV